MKKLVLAFTFVITGLATTLCGQAPRMAHNKIEQKLDLLLDRVEELHNEHRKAARAHHMLAKQHAHAAEAHAELMKEHAEARADN